MRFLVALEELLQDAPSLRSAQQFLSKHYRQHKTSQQVYARAPLAYLATRCPATFAAARAVLSQIKTPIKTLLDLGAGPGTATFAAFEVFPKLQTAHLFEKNSHAIDLGKQIAAKLSIEPTWHHQSLETLSSFPAADLALFSYSLGELKHPESILEQFRHIPMIVLIEPGTPDGYQTILRARKYLLSQNFSLLAPCPHVYECPLQEGNWCHFSSRLPRTRLHRHLKGAKLGYEDEKYSYLIASRTPAVHTQSRILRHPQKHSGHVKLVLCTPEGKEEEKVITRKDKEQYKRAKDVKWGELF